MTGTLAARSWLTVGVLVALSACVRSTSRDRDRPDRDDAQVTAGADVEVGDTAPGADVEALDGSSIDEDAPSSDAGATDSSAPDALATDAPDGAPAPDVSPSDVPGADAPAADAHVRDAARADADEPDAAPFVTDTGERDGGASGDGDASGAPDSSTGIDTGSNPSRDAAPVDSGQIIDSGQPDVGPSPPPRGAFRVTALGTRCRGAYTAGHGFQTSGLSFDADHVFRPLYALRTDRLSRSRPLYADHAYGDALFGLTTDLETSTLYSFANGSSMLRLTGAYQGPTIDISSLLTIGDWDFASDSPPWAPVPTSLTRTIHVPSNPAPLRVFTGVGRAVLWDGARLWDVALPSGVVTDLGPASFASSAAGTFTGIAEHFDGSLHLLYPTSSTAISRYRVADGTTTVAFRFGWLGDVRGISFIPEESAWIASLTGGSELVGTSTLSYPWLGVCDGAFDTPGNPAPPSSMSARPPHPTGATRFFVSGAAEPGGAVTLFSDRSCTTPLGAPLQVAPDGRFEGPVDVPERSATRVYAAAFRPDGTRSLCAIGPIVRSDATAPVFGGLVQATSFQDGIALSWDAARDAVSRTPQIRYEVCIATTPGECLSSFRVDRAIDAGRLRAWIDGLTPATYSFVVRACDESGNCDRNRVERSAAMGSHGPELELLAVNRDDCLKANPGPIGFGVASVLAVDSSAMIQGGLRYAPDDLDLLEPWTEGRGSLWISDLEGDHVYALGAGAVPLGAWSSQSPQSATDLLELDRTTGAVVRVRPLSSTIVVSGGSAIFSGFGRAAIRDHQWRWFLIDLSSGDVTALTLGGAAPEPGAPGLCPAPRQGVLEQHSGDLHLLYTRWNDLYRYSIAAGLETLVTSLDDIELLCGITLSPRHQRVLWATDHDTVESCESVIAPPAAARPDAGVADAGSFAPIPAPAPGVACTNGSRTDCNPAGTTGTAFVDPAPPPGFVQCAGFVDTIADDIQQGWESNCVPYAADRLWLRVYDDQTGVLLAGARLSWCEEERSRDYSADLQEGSGLGSVRGICQGGGDVWMGWASGTSLRATCLDPNAQRFATSIRAKSTGGGRELLVDPTAHDSFEAIWTPISACPITRTRALRIAVYARP